MFDARMMAVLLVKGSAPPMPSTWRMSGLPNARRRNSVRCCMSAGRSESRKKRALLVPPRMIVHGMEDSFTAGMRIGLLRPPHAKRQLYSQRRGFACQRREKPRRLKTRATTVNVINDVHHKTNDQRASAAGAAQPHIEVARATGKRSAQIFRTAR